VSAPTLKLEAAFGDNPFATPTWVDISAYLRGFEINRGRRDQFTTIKAGTATFLLENGDSRFNSWNTLGPYTGNIVPMTQIQFTATWAATPYVLFRGHAESWPSLWPGVGGFDSVAPLTCADAMIGLAFHEDATSRSQEKTGTRIGGLLTTAGFPAGLRNLDVGDFDIAAVNPQCDSILKLIREAEKVEAGLFFIARDGDATFQDRGYRAALVGGPTYGDGGGAELPYENLAVESDASEIWNEITAVAADGSSVTVGDTPSQNRYFTRRLKQFDVHAKDTTDLTSLANALLARYKDPVEKVPGIRIKPERDDTNIWPQVLSDDISARVTVKRVPPGGGDTLSQVLFIEGIHIRGTPSSAWTVDYDLSPYT
jgi:hypothetical protein